MNPAVRFVCLSFLTSILILPCHGWCAESWYNNGLDALGAGKYDEAISAFSKALEADPNRAGAYNNRAIAWSQKGEYVRAMEDYNKALEIDPARVELYNNRGAIWFYLGNYQKAIDDYDKALEIDPYFFRAYANRGSARFHMGNHQTAISDYRKALEINPDSVETRQQLSWIMSNIPDSRSAMVSHGTETGNKKQTVVASRVASEPQTSEGLPESMPLTRSGPGYSVQAGAFQSEANAERLASLLKGKGYDAEVVPFITFSKKTMFAVRIGTYGIRKEAEAKAAAFTETENMPSVVRPADSL